MSHYTGYGTIILSASTDLGPDCGLIQLTSSTQSLSKTTYPGLFSDIGYSVGGSGDSFLIPAAVSPISGAEYYITVGEAVP